MEEFIGTLFAIGLVIWLVVWLFKTYTVQIVFVGIGIVAIFIATMINKAAKQRQAEAAAQKADEDSRVKRHKADQDYCNEQLLALGENSLVLFESLPKHLMSAEEHLNQAEIDFSDGAFAPFWDSIENAAKMLGHFDEGVQNIKDNSSRYIDLVREYEDVPPQFPLESTSIEKLPIATSTSERMKTIVRNAQRNFQFATIYEQRKTNQILVAGFTNLAQALDRMTWQITDSIDNLNSSVDSMTTIINESISSVNSQLTNLVDSNAKFHSEAMKAKSEHAAREKKVLHMLDNIQFHRKPIL